MMERVGEAFVRPRRGSAILFRATLALSVMPIVTDENRGVVQAEPTDEESAFEVPVPWDMDRMEPPVVEAMNKALTSVRDRPSDGSAVGRLGMFYHANDLVALSIPCYRRACQLAPDEPQWHHLLARASVETGDVDTADREWREVLRIVPEYGAALFGLGELLLDTNRAEEAAAFFERLVKVAPDSGGGYYGLGRVEYLRENYERAEEWFRRARDRAPRSKAVLHRLGMVCRRLGRARSDPARIEQAREYLRAAGGDAPVTLVPDPLADVVQEMGLTSHYLSYRARLLVAADRIDEATDLLEVVVGRHPDNEVYLLQLADLRLQQGEEAEAKAFCERAARAAPRNPGPWAKLAETCLNLRDYPGAYAAARRALALSQRDVQRLVLFGRVCLESGQLQESVRTFREVLSLDSERAEAAVRLADALVRLQRPDEALPVARRAVELAPDSAYAHFELAVALDLTGDAAAAEQELRTVLTLEPSSQAARRLLDWIERRRTGRDDANPSTQSSVDKR